MFKFLLLAACAASLAHAQVLRISPAIIGTSHPGPEQVILLVPGPLTSHLSTSAYTLGVGSGHAGFGQSSRSSYSAASFGASGGSNAAGYKFGATSGLSGSSSIGRIGSSQLGHGHGSHHLHTTSTTRHVTTGQANGLSSAIVDSAAVPVPISVPNAFSATGSQKFGGGYSSSAAFSSQKASQGIVGASTLAASSPVAPLQGVVSKESSSYQEKLVRLSGIPAVVPSITTTRVFANQGSYVQPVQPLNLQPIGIVKPVNIITTATSVPINPPSAIQTVEEKVVEKTVTVEEAAGRDNYLHSQPVGTTGFSSQGAQHHQNVQSSNINRGSSFGGNIGSISLTLPQTHGSGAERSSYSSSTYQASSTSGAQAPLTVPKSYGSGAQRSSYASSTYQASSTSGAQAPLTVPKSYGSGAQQSFHSSSSSSSSRTSTVGSGKSVVVPQTFGAGAHRTSEASSTYQGSSVGASDVVVPHVVDSGNQQSYKSSSSSYHGSSLGDNVELAAPQTFGSALQKESSQSSSSVYKGLASFGSATNENVDDKAADEEDSQGLKTSSSALLASTRSRGSSANHVESTASTFEESEVPIGKPEPFSFKFETEDDQGTKVGRQETSDDTGKVTGSYSITDANGIQRVVTYEADEDGFRAQVQTNEPGTKSSNPANVDLASSYVEPEEDETKPAVAASSSANHY